MLGARSRVSRIAIAFRSVRSALESPVVMLDLAEDVELITETANDLLGSRPGLRPIQPAVGHENTPAVTGVSRASPGLVTVPVVMSGVLILLRLFHDRRLGGARYTTANRDPWPCVATDVRCAGRLHDSDLD